MKFAGLPLGEFFESEAVDLAIGTVDTDGRIDRVSRNAGMLLGRDYEELAGADLASLVHPDDIARLSGVAGHGAASSEVTFMRLRLRRGGGDWVETRCLLFPLPEGPEGRQGFVMAQTVGDAFPQSDSERIAVLERNWLRLEAELHARWSDYQSPAVDTAHVSGLNLLSGRQREVVDRLLRGERVSSIAASMYIGASTVRNHLSHAFAVFGVHSQVELLALLQSESAAAQLGQPEHRS